MDLAPLSLPTASTERLLASSPILVGLDPSVPKRLATFTCRSVVTRGARLFEQETEARAFYFLASGVVKLQRQAPDGSVCIAGLFGPKEAVGVPGVLGGQYPATAVVVSPRAEILRVEASPLSSLMRTAPDVAVAVNRWLLRHTLILHEKLRVLSAGAVSQRLAALLLCLSDRFGDESEDGTLWLPLLLSRAELAELIGARVETTIRTLTAWHRRGLVRLEREGIALLDPGSLRAMLGARPVAEICANSA